MEQGLTKQRIISELTRSAHGKLDEYIPIARQSVSDDPSFMAHLIAWNEKKGQIRDSKVALPVAVLVPGFAYTENSLAHLALLDPRNLVRALRFYKEAKGGGQYGMQIDRMVERYLRAREKNYGRWERTALQHRASLKTLYAMNHVHPASFADAILFKKVRPPGSVFEAVAQLKDMTATAAAGTIMQKKIPFLIAVSALGKRMQETDLVMAIIDSMSPAELVTNTKMLERLGVRTVPALRSAYEAGLQKVAASKAVTLKTTRAAQAMTDEVLKSKLVAAQEKQLASMSVEGNWLVLGDKSGSMTQAIELSRLVAATLAKMVKGEVRLVFFDNTPRHFNVSGMTYDQIMQATGDVRASGGTSIGCGVAWALDKGLDVQGIAIVSDGGENAIPAFAPTYQRLCKVLDRDIPIYLYLTAGDANTLSRSLQAHGIDHQVIDLRAGNVDYYSLPNLVQTMRASRYSLTDEIMEAPLLTLDEVFAEKEVKHAA